MAMFKKVEIWNFTWLQWQISLEFLVWPNLKLLMQVTLNAFIRTLHTILKHQPFILLLIVMQIALKQFDYVHVATWMMLLIMYILLLCVRPSIERKKIKYIFHYVPFMIGWLVLIGIIAFMPEFFGWLVSLLDQSWGLCIKAMGYIFIIPGICFASFFFVDTEFDIFSSIPWLLMWWYTLPLSCISVCLIGILYYGWYSLKLLLLAYLSMIVIQFINVCLFYLVALFIICWFNTLYLKKLYQDIEFYIQ